MRRSRAVAFATASLVGAAVALPLGITSAGAAPGTANRTASPAASDHQDQSDVLNPPWEDALAKRNQAALEKRLRQGGQGDSVKLGKHKYGKVGQTGSDKIFVVLAEFGDISHSAYPAGDSDAQRTEGPLHNEIPKPDRSEDNTTVWQKDYSRSHYQNLYFNKVRKFYEQQSTGKYTIDGQVTEWVKVPFNEARYGRNYCGDIVCSSTYFLIRDALAEWTQSKLDAGWSMEKIQTYLKSFDHKDRYDFDGDGDFDEPDGYIDHFQIVHAGGDEADGDPIYGEDAIWSHKSYASIHPEGTGPANGPQLGGVNVGEGGLSDPDGAKVEIPDNPTGVWVGNYTIQPENGGESVFAHEYGHDLGLPDLYDTSGNTGGASNSVEHWSLMSQSRGTLPKDGGIGEHPQAFGAWEKLQLGWLDYQTARAQHGGKYRLRPGQQVKGKASNGLVVLLPNKHVPLELGAPCAECGEKYFYSGSGNELDNTMTHEVSGGGELTAKVRYEIEEGWDYAFLQASSDGGENWTNLKTSQSYTGEDQGGANPDGTGLTGSTDGKWVDLTATIPDGTDAIRFRYKTDPAVALQGLQVDNVTLDGETIGTAETDDEGWELDGFRTTTGSEDQSFLNAYIVDNRQYVGRDKLLKHIYNFVNPAKNPTKVEFFRNEPGALISYWDTSYTDNNVGDHPGGGQILPVDAHPVFIHSGDQMLRNKIQTLDSTFSTHHTKKQVVHFNGDKVTIRKKPAVSVFDDTKTWWYAGDEHGAGDHPGFYEPEWMGVDVPKTGTRIEVLHVGKHGVMTVRVGSSN